MQAGFSPAPRGTVLQRLRRFAPYFRGAGWALPGMVIATTLAAVTEPVIPALMQPLLQDAPNVEGVTMPADAAPPTSNRP